MAAAKIVEVDERVGDHATNIVEVIEFQMSGSWRTDDRPKGDDGIDVASQQRFKPKTSAEQISYTLHMTIQICAPGTPLRGR